MRIEDYEAVRELCTDCSDVGAALDKSTNVVYNGHSSNNTDVRGYTWTMLSLNNIDIAMGRGFTPADEEHGTHDAIVGYDIVDNILGPGDPIGKEIRVDGIPYTIVGVGERQGKTLGQSQDNWVAVPITTYQQTYGYNDSVDIYARVAGGAQVMERAEDQVRVLMRTRRHDAPGTPDDFEIETNDTFLDIWKQISSLFASVVLGLASISLVVGGIVIMNIMLVSVYGADARDRRAQGAGRQAARCAAAVPHRERAPWRRSAEPSACCAESSWASSSPLSSASRPASRCGRFSWACFWPARWASSSACIRPARPPSWIRSSRSEPRCEKQFVVRSS